MIQVVSVSVVFSEVSLNRIFVLSLASETCVETVGVISKLLNRQVKSTNLFTSAASGQKGRSEIGFRRRQISR